MRTRSGGREAVDRETAETIAVQGLAFLAEDRGRLERFLQSTGLEPSDLRTRAGSPMCRLTAMAGTPRNADSTAAATVPE